MTCLTAADRVKARAHFGCEGGYIVETHEQIRNSGRLSDANVKKAYAAALHNIMLDWPIFQCHDMWIPFEGHFSRCGLYKVLTNEFSVMKGNNIYSLSMVMYICSISWDSL